MLVNTNDLPHEVRYTKTDAVISAIGATLLIVSEMLGAIVALILDKTVGRRTHTVTMTTEKVIEQPDAA